MAEQPGSALGTMTYPGLSEEKLKDMIEDGFDETQIKKQNERVSSFCQYWGRPLKSSQ